MYYAVFASGAETLAVYEKSAAALRHAKQTNGCVIEIDGDKKLDAETCFVLRRIGTCSPIYVCFEQSAAEAYKHSCSYVEAPFKKARG